MDANGMDIHDLDHWGLPESIVSNYNKTGLYKVFPWQADCLKLPGVLDGRNLVYSAPTSAGKSLVVEILLLKRLIETGKKAIVILPFVSVAREKMFSMRSLFEVSGLRVDGYMGGMSPPGGFSSVDVAVCTIEKANGLINRLIEEGQINQLCMLVVDEVHMVSDEHRGYLIELLLTKIRFMCEMKRLSSSFDQSPNIQIVGMSATVPNLDLLATWLNAAHYQTDFRPVPLHKCIKIGAEIFDESLNKIRDFKETGNFQKDEDDVTSLCFETLGNGHSVLIFCPTKNWCEKLAKSIAYNFYLMNSAYSHDDKLPCIKLNLPRLRDIVEQLRRSPAGIDDVLVKTVPHGVAYHHAGLTTEERDIIEVGFRNVAIRVLVATSTLSSGVNLPARRVIIRSPVFNRNILDVRSYHQMAGRAGRKGIDDIGESILICKPHEKAKGRKLVSSKLLPIRSCLATNPNSHSQISSAMKRAILEIIVNGIASNYADVQTYLKCTLLSAQATDTSQSKRRRSSQTEETCTDNGVITTCIQWLRDHEFVHLQHGSDEEDITLSKMTATQLGRAALISSLPTAEALRVLADLQTAARALALDTELHLIYQITPISSFSDMSNINWFTYLNIYERLPPAHLRVSELVGVEERFITRMAASGGMRFSGRMSEKRERQINIHTRFYSSLILHDLVQEVPLGGVCEKYSGNRGMIQSLQQSAAGFAGMVTAFCQQLGWWSLEILLKEFQTRLIFGVQRELLDLTQISLLNNERARALYSAGLTSCEMVAEAKPSDVEAILRNSNKFISKRSEANQEDFQIHGIRVAGSNTALTEEEAALAIIGEARKITNVQEKIGIPVSTESGLEISNKSIKEEKLKDHVGLDKKNANEISELHQREQSVSSVVTEERGNCDKIIGVAENKSHTDSCSALTESLAEKPGFCFEENTPVNLNSNKLNETGDASTACNRGDLVNEKREADLPLTNSIPEDCPNTSEDVFICCNQIAQSLGRTNDDSANPCPSITESQIVAVLDSDFSFLKSQKHQLSVGPIKNNLPVLPLSSELKENEVLLTKSLRLPDNVSSSTPIAQTTEKKQTSITFQSNSLSEPSPVAALKETVSSGSFEVSEHDSSINDLFSSRNNFSNDMFNEKSSKCSETPLRNIESGSLVNWSSESAFNYGSECLLVGKRSDKSPFAKDLSETKSQSAGTSNHTDNSLIFSPNLTRSSSASLQFAGSRQIQSLEFPESEDSVENNSLDLYNEKPFSEYTQESVIIEGAVTITDASVNKSTFKKFLKDWSKQTRFSISIALEQNVSSSKNYETEQCSASKQLNAVNGISVCWEEYKVYFVNFKDNKSNSQQIVEDLKNVIGNFAKDIIVISFHIKRLFKKLLHHCGILLGGYWQDPDIAAWMLETEYENEDIFALVKKYVPDLSPLLNELVQNFMKTSHSCDVSSKMRHIPCHVKSCVEALSSFHLMKVMTRKLEESGMWNAFSNIEMPHLFNIAQLEVNGVAMDTELLKKYKTKLHETHQKLQQAAWDVVGRKFNLSSPTEVSKILFGELGLAPSYPASKNQKPTTKLRNTHRASIKRSKKGWSTNKEVLEDLCRQKNPHPLPMIIMNWRGVSHALNMVLHPLHSILLRSSSDDDTCRHHPVALTCTATGRISMLEPNIQNIPKTMNISVPSHNDKDSPENLVFCLRDLLKASEGFVLLSADYSQLELRLMAHMSRDQALLNVFRSGGDIFRVIGADLSGKSDRPDDVTDEERTTAKRICYGILYGMGAQTLAKQMNTSEAKAQSFMDKFLKNYPQLKVYLRKIVDECRKNGYVETVSGRRRFLPDITGSSLRSRAHAERQAVNSSVQGSAADLIKAATCKINLEMKKRGWNTILREDLRAKTKGINQCYFVHHIHDEIMYEVEAHAVKEAAVIIRDCMMSGLPLTVPLGVKLKSGPTWGNLNELVA